MLCPENPIHNFDAQCKKCINCACYYDCQAKDQEDYLKSADSEKKKNICPYYSWITFAKGKCKVCPYYEQCLHKFCPEEFDVKKNKNPITDSEMKDFKFYLNSIQYDLIVDDLGLLFVRKK